MGLCPGPRGLTLWFPGGSDKERQRAHAHCLPETHLGARVAPQRCPILPGGKAAIGYHLRGNLSPLKFKKIPVCKWGMNYAILFPLFKKVWIDNGEPTQVSEKDTMG